MTRLWICTSCGASESLTIFPDCCSSCGGSMETQDGRYSTCVAEIHHLDEEHFAAIDVDIAVDGILEEWANAAVEDFEREMAAEETGLANIIRLWWSGVPLNDDQSAALQTAMLGNRVDQMQAVFGAAA